MNNYNNTYQNLKIAQSICADYEQINHLYDLITYNLGYFLDDYDDFTQSEKEQIFNFSKYALQTVVAYEKLIKKSLI